MDYHKSLKLGISFLKQQQLQNGNFLSFSYPADSTYNEKLSYQTNFLPSIIHHALSTVKLRDAKEISTLILKYLSTQKNKNFSFNYWDKNSNDYKKYPYPDDLDDTVNALLAFLHQGSDNLSAEIMSSIVKLLVATEVKPGGPYNTWLINTENNYAWKSIDITVNASINYLLTAIGLNLKSLDQYLDEQIHSNNIVSEFYRSEVPVIYFLTRGYKGKFKGPLQIKLTEHLNGGRQNDLEFVLCCLAILNLGFELEPKFMNELCRRQNRNGSWRGEAFCYDPSIKKVKYVMGSKALTTALAIECLNKFLSKNSPQLNDTKSKSASYERISNDLIRTDILKSVYSYKSIKVYKKIIQCKYFDEICNLHKWVDASFRGKTILNQEQNTLLAMANIHGWVAYTIYDDVYDNDSGIELLPSANIALRQSYLGFIKLFEDEEYLDLVNRIFTQIDKSNEWEIKNARFAINRDSISMRVIPRYSKNQITNKSLGHLLPALTVILKSDQQFNDNNLKLMENTLGNLIYARQINDDMHDWETDLRKGIINPITAKIFIKAGFKSDIELKLKSDLPQLRTIFWQNIIHEEYLNLTKLLRKSLRQINQIEKLKPSNVLTKYYAQQIDRYDNTLKEIDSNKRFINSYKN